MLILVENKQQNFKAAMGQWKIQSPPYSPKNTTFEWAISIAYLILRDYMLYSGSAFPTAQFNTAVPMRCFCMQYFHFFYNCCWPVIITYGGWSAPWPCYLCRCDETRWIQPVNYFREERNFSIYCTNTLDTKRAKAILWISLNASKPNKYPNLIYFIYIGEQLFFLTSN